MKVPAASLTLEVENAALREENRRLRAEQVLARARQGHSADWEQQQARFRTIFDNSPLGQKIITSDLLIQQANQAVVDMLGCASVADVVGHEIMEFTHPDHRADWRFLQERLWSHKVPSFTLETRLVRTDGSSFWCQVTSIRFPDGGQELGYTQLEDISDRKALEESLKRLYDAQETILHLVTHDLKAPIGHVQMLAELLQRQVDAAPFATDNAQDTAKYLELIRRACTTANKLVKDVLLIGSLDAGSLLMRNIDLGTWLRYALESHQLVAQEKGLTLDLNRPAQPVLAHVNPDALGRVVDNLVSNALKFTPAGGRVTVELQETDVCVRLTVRDTGIGIPEPLQAALFEKFSASARPGLGGEAATGLGLFITRQIVQLHRGKLWVESQEGAGTCFFVELA